MNYIHFIRTENELKSHEKVCKNKQIRGIAMPSEKNNILEFNQYMQSYIIYATIESLIKRIDGWANNQQNYWKKK